MKNVKTYPDDFKLIVVRHYLDTGAGLSSTAKKFKIPAPSTVRGWVNDYNAQLLTPSTQANKQKLEHVKLDERRRLVQHYIETSDSVARTADRFKVPPGSLRKWINQHKHEFKPSDWRKTTHGNVYARAFKLEVVRHYIESNDGLSKTAKKFNLPTHKSVMNWVATFRAELYPSTMIAPQTI